MVNIEGAKYVRIAWDRVTCGRCDGDDECEPYLSCPPYVRIFRVVDEHISLEDTFLWNRGTEISKDMLEYVECQLERKEPTLRVGDDNVVVLKELEVLEQL